ncbi:MAG: DegV domain-containing protein [Firmicutes bacterium ADurb.Bin248]|nr:MAG: DegV domain-containing protein [Firmicutes bacterium ADurb.Bin248]
MAIKITSDSTCDLSPELVERHHIGIIPMYITLGGKSYRDMVDIFPDDIFRHVDAGGDIATTAAIPPHDYTTRFAELSKQYDAVVHIDIGSHFSACYQNASLAAKEFDNVYVVDSKNLSSGHGHVVMEAALMAEAGVPAPELVERLGRIIPKVEASFILNRLDYMRKGGRCSTIAMLGSNALQLKPCIEVFDGAMRVGTKYRGSLEKSIQRYVRDRLEGRDDIVYERIFITHSQASPETVETAREAIRQIADFKEIIETHAGCTVSTHCGPSTLGVLFITK